MSYIKDFTTTYYFGDKKYKITAPARFDEKTNQPIYDAELDERATEMARNAYRADTGPIYPSEIKAFRDAAKLSQSDLATLTGITVSTIALYEAGAFPITKHNKLLKNLTSDDAFLKQTITDNPKVLPSELVSKILDYLLNQQSNYLTRRKNEIPVIEISFSFCHSASLVRV